MWSIFSRNAFGAMPYDILGLVAHDERMIWKLHKGKRKGVDEEVSIFVCESSSSNLLDLAKGAIKRLKMLKHPCILKYIDSLETDKIVYLVTEPITPLLLWLEEFNVSSKSESVLSAWGLLQITKGLQFLNIDGKLVHNNVCESSVFVTHGGEWKLSGLEYASADTQYIPTKAIASLSCYDPPEKANSMKIGNLWASDMWGLGCLIWEVFNGSLNHSNQLEDTLKIPHKLQRTYKELIGKTPSKRPSPADIMEKLQKTGQYFSNDLINVLSVLEEIHIKEDSIKHRFFSGLTNKLDNIPDFIAKNKILPALLNAHEFTNTGSVILAPLFKIGLLLEDEDYQKQIVPCVIRLFSSTDRATRLKLLQQMESLAEHFNPKTINEQIFTPLVTGFQDTNPTIRENTVKAIIFLTPKLNYNNLNIELMKYFAKLQSKDDQGGIRTNTTVCLSKMASYLHPDTRQKCLVSAFTRAMRDPFPPARTAGVTAIAATQQYYPLSDVASKIIPALCHLTLDPDKSVRDAVFRVLKGFIGKLEKVSEDASLQEVMEKEVASAGASSVSATWSGWAVGALTSKFYKGSNTAKVTTKKVDDQESSSLSSTHSTRTTGMTSTGSNATEIQKQKTGLTDIEDHLNSDSKLLSGYIADDADTDGWAAEDYWDDLEVEVEEESKSDSTLRSHSKPSSTSGETDDFFTSIEAKIPLTKNSSNHISSNTDDNSWGDSWDNDTKSEETKRTPISEANDLKRQREEKRIKRQKEIEAKRAERSGPMKLGSRKL